MEEDPSQAIEFEVGGGEAGSAINQEDVNTSSTLPKKKKTDTYNRDTAINKAIGPSDVQCTV